MYLYALGIYHYDPVTGAITLDKIVQKDTIKTETPNQLADLENKLLPVSAFTLVPNRLYYNDDIIEYHYVQRLEKHNLILAIVSRSQMKDLSEIILLFKNMTHIYLNNAKQDMTLEKLLHNPLLKEEVVIQKINETTEEIKEVMIDNIRILIERGENLDLLLEKTKDLKNGTIKFEEKAKDANRCCRW